MDELTHIDQAAAPYTWPHFIIQDKMYQFGIKFNLVDKFSAIIAKANIAHLGHAGAALARTFGQCMNLATIAAASAGKHIMVVGHGPQLENMYFSQEDIDRVIERFDRTRMIIDLRSIDLSDLVIKAPEPEKVIKHKPVTKKIVPKNVNYKNKYNAHKQHRLIVRRR